MRTRNLLLAALLLSAAVVTVAQKAPTKAHAYITDAQGQKVAMAALSSVRGGVRIVLTATNLPPGVHGFHIHNVGRCDPPGFTSAGGHFNPTMKMHGKDNPMGPHLGDLPNITVNAKGQGRANFVAPNVTLGSGPDSLFHDGGTALVIHAVADDYKTDPAGNAGARIACGVILTP
jgi:superoxide dismutase, Cu-Zn family